jgi:thioredoxin-like negative regulator of GroEL
VGGVIVPPAVADAQKRAAENPNDRNAQLDLAFAYWEAGYPPQTYETIGKVIQMTGMGDADYFMQAGDKFKVLKDGWLPAAQLYLQAMRVYNLNGEIPNPVWEAFREAYYKGATRPEAVGAVPLEQVSQLDPLMAKIAQGRNALFAGRPNDAIKLVDEVKQQEENMREALLLEGEIALKQNTPERARLAFETLAADTTSTPEWIRMFAKQLLDGMK